MNVQQAFERLKSARAYLGKIPYHISPAARAHWAAQDTEYRDAVNTLATEHDAQRSLLETLRRAGQVSHEFRAKADKKWDGSYTQKVVDSLRKAFPASFNGDTKWPIGKTVQAAAELLADYHHTMHTIYAQRDEARDLAEKRLQANVVIVEKLRNLGGLTNRHILMSEYGPLLNSIRNMKDGDTIGKQPAQLLLAKIAENEHILDRVRRAEAGEIEAVKSRDETRDKLTLAQNGYRYMKSRVNEISVDLANARKRADSLAAQLDLAEQTLRYAPLGFPTPDTPRKAVHGDILPLMQDPQLSYNSLRDYAATLHTQQAAASPLVGRRWIPDLAVDSAKERLTQSLTALQDMSYNTTPAIAVNHIERLIDAKWDTRRYQK